MTPQELATNQEAQRQNHIRLACEKMKEIGILRFAVLGPKDGDDAALVHELVIEAADFIEAVSYYDSHADVIEASTTPGVAGVVPMYTEGNEPISDHRERLLKVGLSSIGPINNHVTGNSNSIVFRYQGRNNGAEMSDPEKSEIEALETEVLEDNSDPSDIETGLRIVRQAIGAKAVGTSVTEVQQATLCEDPSPYFVPSSNGL